MLTQSRLLELLEYVPELGLFFWRQRRKLAGCVNSQGYRVIRIDTVLYRSSRLVFLYQTGELPALYVDHINRSRCDDRWSNLRLVTNQANQYNTGVSKNNKLGAKGVIASKRKKKPYQAQIKHNGNSIYLGNYETIEQASQAYDRALNNYVRPEEPEEETETAEIPAESPYQTLNEIPVSDAEEKGELYVQK